MSGALKGRKVLVTGAGGFIGSHLVEALLKSGAHVRAFVHYNSNGTWGWLDSFSKDILKNVEVFSGDVRDPHGTLQAVRGVDSICHLAALIGIPYSYQSPDSYVDTNIKGTLNLLQAAKTCDIQRFIQTSTSEVYGSAQTVPISENHPLNAQSPYAATKIAADQLALSFFRSFGTPVVVIRPFNTFGPRQSTRAVIPTIISQALSGAKTIKLGSLFPTRDFTFVRDTVAGYVAALTAKDIFGETINLGSSFEISIGDVAKKICSLAGKQIEIIGDPERVRPDFSEVSRLLADTAKANELLAWKPEKNGIAGLEAALQETLTWFSSPKNQNTNRAERYVI